MTGYHDFIKKFKEGSFISSKEIKKKYELNKALSSLYIFPTFFRGIHYIPTRREQKGRFIENPKTFFYNLFNLVYGRKNWYWSLSTAARYYGAEWSTTKILEMTNIKESKTIQIYKRAKDLENKRSYRSKALSRILYSIGINILFLHKGKNDFVTQIKIDGDIGPVATKQRLSKDLDFFLPRIKNAQLRNLYKKMIILSKKSSKSNL